MTQQRKPIRRLDSAGYNHMVRSVVVSGQKTLTVSLPIVFCREMGIEPGTKVLLNRVPKGFLITKI